MFLFLEYLEKKAFRQLQLIQLVTNKEHISQVCHISLSKNWCQITAPSRITEWSATKTHLCSSATTLVGTDLAVSKTKSKHGETSFSCSTAHIWNLFGAGLNIWIFYLLFVYSIFYFFYIKTKNASVSQCSLLNSGPMLCVLLLYFLDVFSLGLQFDSLLSFSLLFLHQCIK